jgi:hypothetical protein
MDINTSHATSTKSSYQNRTSVPLYNSTPLQEQRS